jgi:hypothetical protein
VNALRQNRPNSLKTLPLLLDSTILVLLRYDSTHSGHTRAWHGH